jgi:hypothetical protein
MAQVSDVSIANQGFSAFRTELNNILAAFNTQHSGTSAPASLAAGSMWLDTSGGATSHILKFYDGTHHITFATVNTTANTIDFSDSSITLADDSVTLAKMASGTDGNIISYDASGDPVAVATGSSGQVFTSAGTGAVPSFATITHPVTAVANLLDNRVTTASSSSALNGEANLTFNGSTLAVTGATTISTTLTLAGAGYLTQDAITSSSNAVAWDVAVAPNAYHLTTENTTFSAPSNAVLGQFISLHIKYGGTHSIGWNTIFEFPASTEPTETAVSAKNDIHVFRYNGAIWHEVGRTQNMASS